MTTVPTFYEINGFGSVDLMCTPPYDREVCGACGRRTAAQRLPKHCTTNGLGRWNDCLHSSERALVVSGRVAAVLRECPNLGATIHPINIEAPKVTKMAARKAPYHWVAIHNTVDIDLEASGIRQVLCGICFATCDHIQRVVVIPSTWPDSLLAVIRNNQCRFRLCTRDFILLARKHRWNGFHFGNALYNMKTGQPESMRWGVDYLSKEPIE